MVGDVQAIEPSTPPLGLGRIDHTGDANAAAGATPAATTTAADKLPPNDLHRNDQVIASPQYTRYWDNDRVAWKGQLGDPVERR
jgi:hypothetical protein